MLHVDRTWCVASVETPQDFAEKLTEMTWCCCMAFQIDGHPKYAWLNDSTSPDNAQEYAVINRHELSGELVQVESITVSWCDEQKLLSFIQHTLDGKDDRHNWCCEVTPHLQFPEEHGRCPHCA